MPALPSPGKVVQVTFHWAIGADLTAISRRFYSYSGAVSGADATTFATAWNTQQAANWRTLTVTSTTFLGTSVTDLSSASGVAVFVSTSSAGTRAGSALPGSAAMVQQLRIARRYRGGKPRAYFPWGTSNDTASAQTWSAAFVTASKTGWDTAENAALAAAPAGMGSVGTVSVSWYQGFDNVTRPSGRETSKPRPRVTPLVDPIIGETFRATIGSQRRRLKPAS